MKTRKQGWYKKAKIKFINKEVENYSLSKKCMFGNDRVEERNGGNLRTVWFGCRQQEFQNDIAKVAGFAERFIWAQNVYREQPDKFYFDYELKRNFKY
jgi:hypothetical protein